MLKFWWCNKCNTTYIYSIFKRFCQITLQESKTSMVKIIADSCSDLSQEQLEKYDIDYARMNTVRGGKETPASLIWEYYTPKELYDAIRAGEHITTTQVPVEEYKRIFTKYLEQGMDIVYIGCSLKQSGSVNTAAVVAKTLAESYPDRSIFCIDSRNSSIGQGMLVIRASKLAAQGKSAAEINDEIIRIRKNVLQFATVNTLEYLRRAGRVKGSAAFFGNLMGVKPILISDANGTQTPIKKVKGRANSFAEIVSMLKTGIRDAEKQTVYIAHADCTPQEVEQLKEIVRREIPCADISVGYIGPIIGASVGPDTIGVWAYGEEVTYTYKE